MSRLVDSRRATLLIAHRHISTLQATDNAVDSREEVLLRHSTLVVTRSDERRLVTYVCDICAGKPRGLLGEELAVELIVELQPLQVHVEYRLTLLNIGESHLYLAVETASAHQRLIQYIYTVCRRQDYNSGICLEAVHLREQLV